MRVFKSFLILPRSVSERVVICAESNVDNGGNAGY